MFITLDRVLSAPSSSPLAMKSLVRVIHDRLWRILLDLHRGPEGRAHGSIDEKHVLLTRHAGVSLLSNLDSESDSNIESGRKDMILLGALMWRLASRTSAPASPPLPPCDSIDRDLYRIIHLLLFEPYVCFNLLLTGAKSSNERDKPSFSVGLLTAEEIDAALAFSSSYSPKTETQTRGGGGGGGGGGKKQKQHQKQTSSSSSSPPPPPPPPRIQSNASSRRTTTSGKAIARSPTSTEGRGDGDSSNISTSSQTQKSFAAVPEVDSSATSAPPPPPPPPLSLRDRLRQEAADRASKQREEELLAARIAAHKERLALQQKSKELLFEPSKQQQGGGGAVHNLARTLAAPLNSFLAPQQATSAAAMSPPPPSLPRSESPLLQPNNPLRKNVKEMQQQADREAEERLLANARIAAHAERLALKEKYGR